MLPRVIQTSSFKIYLKILSETDKQALDFHIMEIVANPYLGLSRIGDLSDIRICTYRNGKRVFQLAYKYDENNRIITLMALDS